MLTDKTPLKVLIIDDDDVILNSFQTFFNRTSYQLYLANNIAEGRALLRKQSPDILILDIKMPQMDGIHFLQEIKTTYPDLIVIMITGHGDQTDIIKAIQAGAFDYFYKPLSMFDIQASLRRAQERIKIKAQLDSVNNDYQQLLSSMTTDSTPRMIASSASMRHVLELSRKAGQADEATVLITGPSGVGKELIAKHIHRSGPRAGNAFFAVNGAAVPDTLFESEFFGHVKGAFTGAVTDKQGCFKEAENGVLFIDEIAELTLAAQIKLLRAIEDKRVRPVGSTQEKVVNVKIIVATNKCLRDEVEKGTFRSDLFYRLNAFEICVPALRQRPEDISPLIEYYIDHFSRKYHKTIKNIEKDVTGALRSYLFPGNVRELRNLCERAVILCDSNNIKLHHFPINELFHDYTSGDKKRVPPTLKAVEQNHIQRVVQYTDGNLSHAARILGISRNTLYNKIGKSVLS